MKLRSFKLRLRDEHVRIVPSETSPGCPFAGPGVDLRGEDARRAITTAAALVRVVEAMEPGARVRSLAVDLDKPRMLATLDPITPEADPRPRVVRVEGGALLDRALDQTPLLVALLGELAAAALARRCLVGIAKGDGQT